MVARVEKAAPAGVFGYAAGKSIIAKQLVGLFPAHQTYVEPLCGSAALYFSKTPVDVEVLNDLNPEVTGALETIRTLSKAEFAELARRDWVGSADAFAKALSDPPTTRVDRLYSFLYTTNFSFGKARQGFKENTNGMTSRACARIARWQPRMAKTIILTGDYRDAIKRFDGPQAFFFLDPPYVGYSAFGANGVGEKDFDERALRKTLEGIKGRFLLTYGVKGKLDTAGFELKRMQQRRTIRMMHGKTGPEFLTHLLVSNYKVTAKRLGEDIELDDVVGIVDVDGNGERIMVSSGTVLSVGGLPQERAFKSEDPLLAYPETAGGTTGAILLRFGGDRSVDATLQVGGIEWSLDVQRAALVGDPVMVAKGFSAEGDRFFRPLTRGVTAHAARARADVTRLVSLVLPVVEHGLQTADFHEYFVSKADDLSGVLTVERQQDGWRATLKPDAVPAVLQAGHPLPPPGISALPVSLEKAVPADLRYWDLRGDEAVRAHAALVASGSLTASSVRLVDGEFCRVVQKLTLCELAPALAAPADWAPRRVAELAGATTHELFSPCASALRKASGLAAGPIYFDAGDGTDDSLTVLTKSLETADVPYVVTAVDSPSVRASLEALGRPFKFRPSSTVGADAVERVFVASFGVRSDDIDWLDSGTPVGKGGDELAAADRGRTDALIDGLLHGQREIHVAKAEATTEERFVLGIVLEPDTVDSQMDTYSADEVRQAAHKFMEEYQNIGLMHKDLINSKAKILENYLAPADFTVGDQTVKKGTWLMAVRVQDGQLWNQVKSGGLTGFSIGGTAQRVPEPNPPPRVGA